MKTFKIIISVLICLAIAVSTYFLVVYADNGNRNFCVKYNNQRLSGEQTTTLETGKYHYFYPATVISFKPLPKENYKVKVLCTSSSVYKYTVDDAINVTAEGVDVTNGFEIVKSDGVVQFKIEKDATFLNVLQKIYEGKNVEIIEGPEDFKNVYFRLVFSSVNENVNVSILFNW